MRFIRFNFSQRNIIILSGLREITYIYIKLFLRELINLDFPKLIFYTDA